MSIGISSGSVHNVLTDIVEMGKVPVKMGTMNADARAQDGKGDVTRTLLTRNQANPKNFHNRLITPN